MLRGVLIGLIRFYRRAISPWTPAACRFQPTCSAYALEAVERHGALRGSALAAKRLLRCHPWGGSGYDPVPQGLVEGVSAPTPAAGGEVPENGTDGVVETHGDEVTGTERAPDMPSTEKATRNP